MKEGRDVDSCLCVSLIPCAIMIHAFLSVRLLPEQCRAARLQLCCRLLSGLHSSMGAAPAELHGVSARQG